MKTDISIKPERDRVPFSTSPQNGQWRETFVARFRALLRCKRLTVNMLSKMTESLYGRSSNYFIPHNICSGVLSHRTSPHICQIFALSRVTGYHFLACLSYLGFPPDIITRCQALLSSDDTVLLPSTSYGRDRLIPFLGSIVLPQDLDQTGPLGSKVRRDATVNAAAITNCSRRTFVYARIGCRDALGFPHLLPGSIVRVDLRRAKPTSQSDESSSRPKRRPIFLVWHPKGLVCCHVDLVGKDRVLLTPSYLPFKCLEYQLNEEAVILGTVDAEVRDISAVSMPDFASFNGGSLRLLPRTPSQNNSLSTLMRFHREQNHVTFRQASQMTSEIANYLGRNDYIISSASFSDFEASSTLPHRIERVFSVCMVYKIDLLTLLRAAQLPLDEMGRDPLPESLIEDNHRETEPDSLCPENRETFARYLCRTIEEIPLFLTDFAKELLLDAHGTSRSVFWVGGQAPVYHPWMEGARVVVVESTAYGSANQPTWTHEWERPIQVLFLRDSRYLIGFCSLSENRITLVSHRDCRQRSLQFVRGRDAELIGKVTAIGRLIPR
jgi:hypothetical protein